MVMDVTFQLFFIFSFFFLGKIDDQVLFGSFKLL